MFSDALLDSEETVLYKTRSPSPWQDKFYYCCGASEQQHNQDLRRIYTWRRNSRILEFISFLPECNFHIFQFSRSGKGEVDMYRFTSKHSSDHCFVYDRKMSARRKVQLCLTIKKNVLQHYYLLDTLVNLLMVSCASTIPLFTWNVYLTWRSFSWSESAWFVPWPPGLD